MQLNPETFLSTLFGALFGALFGSLFAFILETWKTKLDRERTAVLQLAQMRDDFAQAERIMERNMQSLALLIEYNGVVGAMVAGPTDAVSIAEYPFKQYDWGLLAERITPRAAGYFRRTYFDFGTQWADLAARVRHQDGSNHHMALDAMESIRARFSRASRHAGSIIRLIERGRFKRRLRHFPFPPPR